MKKARVMLMVLLVLGGAGAAAYFYTGDARRVGDLTWQFWESIQYKDFDAAADLHSEADRKDADIAGMIERKFHIKPENLNVKSIDVRQVEINSSGKRARSLTRVEVDVLNVKAEKPPVEAMLYWKKEDGHWYLDLKSSL
jgi:hypothetical protein